MLRSRSKSCYIDRPVELDEHITKNEVPLKKKYESVDNSKEELIVTLEAPAMLTTPTKSKTQCVKKKQRRLAADERQYTAVMK